MKEYLNALLRDYARAENSLYEWKGIQDGRVIEFAKLVFGQRYVFALIWENGRWEPLDWHRG